MQNLTKFLALLAPMLAISACAGLTQSQATADVQTLAAGIKGLDAAIGALPGVPANVVAQVAKEDALIQADAAQIASAAVPNANIATEINDAVGVIATLATPFFPEAPAIAAVVSAATTLGQVIVQETGATP
ncbi:MAG: hypothetical protein ACYC97_13430, partial [Metallibacterium sp.]